MNAPTKVPSLTETCRIKRVALLEAFCALEMELAALLGPAAPRMFSQKIDKLSEVQLKGIDAKSLIASRNLVAHAHIVGASRAGTPISVWQVPHHDIHLNARVMARDDLEQWYESVNLMIAKLRERLAG